jgi:hypothetical protein
MERLVQPGETRAVIMALSPPPGVPLRDLARQAALPAAWVAELAIGTALGAGVLGVALEHLVEAVGDVLLLPAGIGVFLFRFWSLTSSRRRRALPEPGPRGYRDLPVGSPGAPGPSERLPPGAVLLLAPAASLFLLFFAALEFGWFRPLMAGNNGLPSPWLWIAGVPLFIAARVSRRALERSPGS